MQNTTFHFHVQFSFFSPHNFILKIVILLSSKSQIFSLTLLKCSVFHRNAPTGKIIQHKPLSQQVCENIQVLLSEHELPSAIWLLQRRGGTEPLFANRQLLTASGGAMEERTGGRAGASGGINRNKKSHQILL